MFNVVTKNHFNMDLIEKIEFISS